MVRGRGRRYKIGCRGIRGLETKVGQECSISRGGGQIYSGGMHVGGVLGGSHSVTAGGSSKSESCQAFPAHTEQGKTGPGLG